MGVRRIAAHKPVVSNAVSTKGDAVRVPNQSTVRCEACGRLVYWCAGILVPEWRHAIDFTYQGYDRWRVYGSAMAMLHFDDGNGKPICGRRRPNGVAWNVGSDGGFMHCKRCTGLVAERRLVRRRSVSSIEHDDFATTPDRRST